MRAFFLVAVGLLISLTQWGCGAYHESHVKNYKLYFATSDANILSEAQRLIHLYNREAQTNVLEFASNITEANSTVKFDRELKEREGKLGYGKWETEIYEEPDFRRLEGRTLERVITYSMELEFDEKFFKERAGKSESDLQWQRLYVLFLHEVGHGLQMSHIEDERNVMNPNIVEDPSYIRFDEYFHRVRSFIRTTQ